MGEVYKARDTRLGRDVAIKVLRAAVAADAARLRRFEREARTVAGLNHPNIVTLYDVGTHDGSPFLVSELLEGRTLREALRDGMRGPATLGVALQIAHGLAAAHEKGVVHRDLKPANVFVTSSGHVKILDFGVAKLARAGSAFQDEDLTTETGAVVGTVGYMAPEQVRGRSCDHRADIFAFGCVLYELASGHRAFTGDSAADVLSAILHDDPLPLQGSRLPATFGLQHVVDRCLAKSPSDRFQSAKDLGFALESVLGSREGERAAVSPSVPGPARVRWRLLATAAAGVMALAVLVAVDGRVRGRLFGPGEAPRRQTDPQESQRPAVAMAVDAVAVDAARQGHAMLESATREEQFRRAVVLFQTAIDRDPQYATAWAGKSEALWAMAATGFEFVHPGNVRETAIAAAERALSLDSRLPEAHKARAMVAYDGEWDLAKAQEHFEHALELRPGYAAAHNLYAQMLYDPLRRFDESRRHLDAARAIDPLSPWNDINLAAFWLYGPHPERALDGADRARLLNPRLWAIPWLAGLARLRLDRPDLAVRDFDAALGLLESVRPPPVLAPLALADGLAGRHSQASAVLTELEEMARRAYVSPLHLAVANSGLGRMDEAFRLLDQALRDRTPWLAGGPANDPLFVALRRDPRWPGFSARLRQRVRLPPGTPATDFSD